MAHGERALDNAMDVVVEMPVRREVLAACDSSRKASWLFFRQWLRSPLTIASIVPSGRQLAAHMVAALPARPRCLIEIGAGTGVFTHAMLNHGFAPQQLLVVERNDDLYALLVHRFADVAVVHGDAADLAAIVRTQGFGRGVPVDAVVSGLGLRPMSPAQQRIILDAAFAVLAPGGVFLQFTYGRTGPVSEQVLREAGLCCERVSVAWRNIPPASVFVYRAVASAAASAGDIAVAG